MFHVEQKSIFDIIVVGGGHAGVEAAWAAKQFDLKVAIFSLPGIGLASAPCNPAVGGVGKGQVVREIDALGGLMGKLADLSGIQYRTLNESKGYAVQSTRIQIDKEHYTRVAELEIAKAGIEVIRGKVTSITKEELFHVELSNSSRFSARKLIVTTGTFLAGEMHTGSVRSPGGRFNEENSPSLKNLFSSVKTLNKRFKTGTPPRIRKSTIDFSRMTEQKSDESVSNFHFNHKSQDRFKKQASCFITHTNSETIAVIDKNKQQSPIFNGQIQGIGPRYCPSIEDKAFRYPDRSRHHIFVEPESLELSTFYPNGISTSLPREAQQEMINSIEGLERAEIEIYGYAVEYDVVDTSRLNSCLEYGDIPGLYFAGQVNGTSGYEEAAGQGLIAGMNAAIVLRGTSPLVLDRSESYIGVMIEDLVSSRRDEPYRLFTARSENRLSIREDNTYARICPYRTSLGLDKKIDKFHVEHERQSKLLQSLIDTHRFYRTSEDDKIFFEKHDLGELTIDLTLKELLCRSHVDPVKVLYQFLAVKKIKFMSQVVRYSAIESKYSGYIKRQERDNDRSRRFDRKKINWKAIVEKGNVSTECKQRIERFRPETFIQLKKIEGIRPATLAYVAGMLQ